jgi:hypothetical protein
MHRILLKPVAGALVALALGATTASAAAPPAAFVRVEGTGATLLAQTLVQTTSATQVKGKACPGTSAAAALDAATAGNWAGSYSTKFSDYLVGTILGETPTGNNFWTLWVNGRSSSTGGCSTPLHPADHVLWFDCVADANFNCTNNPLSLSAPSVVQRNHAFNATVTQLDGAGHSAPITGAAVSGNGVAGVSGTGGSTRLVAHQRGVITIQATKSGATPSDPVFVCVYAVRRSECGSAGNGPAVHVNGILEHEKFTHAKAPRTLSGTAGPDPSGLTDVSLSLFRHAPHNHCFAYDGDSGRWRATSCRGAKAPFFSVGASADWSYLLPAVLPVGTYRLEVVASDGAAHQTKLQTGISKLDFTVK